MEERSGIDWLGEIAVHAQAEAALLIFDDGEDDDRNVHGGGVVLQHRCDIESIHLRHHDVENHQSRSLFADQCERLAPVLRKANHVPGFCQLLLQQRTDIWSRRRPPELTCPAAGAWRPARAIAEPGLQYRRSAAPATREAGALGPRTGSVKENVLPSPGSLSTQMRPP